MAKKAAELARLYELRERRVWAVAGDQESTLRKVLHGIKGVRLYRRGGDLRLRVSLRGTDWTEWVLSRESVVATWGTRVRVYSRSEFDRLYELASASPTLSVQVEENGGGQ